MSGENTACCCAPAIPEAPYIIGSTETSVGAVPAVKTELSAKDVLGAFRVRWGIGRMNYKVEPGIYSIGKPDENSPVLVTANYKLTFDSLRKELTGLNLWILVLNTKGVNVWCAAGKGTFGTKELVFRIKAVKLGEIVKHRTLILPQLGATGVAAHAVTKLSGFHVVYGPVRASDIKGFLSAGMKATPEMREVKFTLKDRVVLTPVDLVYWMKPLVILFGALFVLNAIGIGRFGLSELIGFLGAVITGCVITPILLPWIPGRAFSLKGTLLGVIWAAACIFFVGGFAGLGVLKAISYILLLPSVSAYTAMNFTGSSTYLSNRGKQGNAYCHPDDPRCFFSWYDCSDCRQSNKSIFIKGAMIMKHQYLKNVVALKLDSEKCVGCGMCVTVCPHHVFELADEKAKIADLNSCMECGACSKNCAFSAISVKPGVGCAAAIIKGILTGSEPSCDCSSGECC